MGSKRRIAKHILPIILKDRRPNQWYVEPFCGGCNSLDRVANPRIANDNNPYLIALLKHLQTNEPFTAPNIDEHQYKHIQRNKDEYPAWLVGYVGFGLSFGAKFFGGYRRDKQGIRDYQAEAIRNIRQQQPHLQGIHFHCGDYQQLRIPPNSIIYCDPPYANTTRYQTDFDHTTFMQWCRYQRQKGHRVLVSEYAMPPDFTCVWSGGIISNLDANAPTLTKTEKLWELDPKTPKKRPNQCLKQVQILPFINNLP